MPPSDRRCTWGAATGIRCVWVVQRASHFTTTASTRHPQHCRPRLRYVCNIPSIPCMVVGGVMRMLLVLLYVCCVVVAVGFGSSCGAALGVSWMCACSSLVAGRGLRVGLLVATQALAFDFSAALGKRDLPRIDTNLVDVPITRSGHAHAVLMWWDCDLWNGEVMYTTRPDSGQAWQDHWVQVWQYCARVLVICVWCLLFLIRRV